MKSWFVLLMFPVLATFSWAQSPVPGPNVNMVSGTSWTTGDPFRQRQNDNNNKANGNPTTLEIRVPIGSA